MYVYICVCFMYWWMYVYTYVCCRCWWMYLYLYVCVLCIVGCMFHVWIAMCVYLCTYKFVYVLCVDGCMYVFICLFVYVGITVHPLEPEFRFLWLYRIFELVGFCDLSSILQVLQGATTVNWYPQQYESSAMKVIGLNRC